MFKQKQSYTIYARLFLGLPNSHRLGNRASSEIGGGREREREMGAGFLAVEKAAGWLQVSYKVEPLPCSPGWCTFVLKKGPQGDAVRGSLGTDPNPDL